MKIEKINDIPAVLKFFSEEPEFLQSESPEEITDELLSTADFGKSFVVMDGENIAGAVLLHEGSIWNLLDEENGNNLPSKEQKGLEIDVLRVSPEYRNKGISKLLIDEWEKVGAAYDYIFLQVYEHLKTHQLYKNIGYSLAGIYNPNGEDVYVYLKGKTNVQERIQQIIKEEFLRENTLNRAKETWQKEKEKLARAIKSAEGEEKVENILPDKSFQFLIDNDPSVTHKYSMWMIQQFARMQLAGQFFYANEILSAVRDFDRFVGLKLIKGEASNIYSYKTFLDLDKVLNVIAKELVAKTLNSAKEKIEGMTFAPIEMTPDPNASKVDIILATDSYYIVHPRNFNASVHYANGANWCVADKTGDDRYYNSYTGEKQYTLYFLRITNLKLLGALSIVCEKWGVESLPKSISNIIIGRKEDGGWDVKDFFNKDLPNFLDFFKLLKIDPEIFKIVPPPLKKDPNLTEQKIARIVKEELMKEAYADKYYDFVPGMTIQQVIDNWKNGKKVDEGSMPIMLSVNDLWPYREYTWTRETSRSHRMKVDGEYKDLKGPEKWDILKKEMSANGWSLQEQPLIFQINHFGKAKVSEGNHRLAIAKELGIEKVPVSFIFVQGVKED